MNGTGLRDPLELSIGLAIGTGLVTLATGDRPGVGFALGIALVPVFVVALARLDGPLEVGTARIGATVVAGGLLAAALWLL